MAATNRVAPAKPDSASGILAGLRFSQALPERKADQKQREPRRVVLDALTEQIAICEADLAGKEFVLKKTRFIKNPDGKSVKTEVSVTPRRAYWKDGEGKYLLGVRYGGAIPVEFVPGNPSILCGDLEDVLATLRIVREAIMNGEGDAAIAAAAAKMKRKPKEA